MCVRLESIEALTRLSVQNAGLAATALDERISRVATVSSPATFVSDVPYEKMRLGVVLPGILKRVGDVPHLAALTVPRRLVIAGGVSSDGTRLAKTSLSGHYTWTTAAFRQHQAAGQLRFPDETDTGAIVAALR